MELCQITTDHNMIL